MKTDKMSHVFSICIDDIIQAIEDNNQTDDLQKIMLIKRAKSLSENDMKWIGSKLSDSFCENGFWELLEDLFKQIVEDDKE